MQILENSSQGRDSQEKPLSCLHVNRGLALKLGLFGSTFCRLLCLMFVYATLSEKQHRMNGRNNQNDATFNL